VDNQGSVTFYMKTERMFKVGRLLTNASAAALINTNFYKWYQQNPNGKEELIEIVPSGDDDLQDLKEVATLLEKNLGVKVKIKQ
jgi:hypothetical protein